MQNNNYKVLLIEDDKFDQMAFMRMVKEQNLPYECTQAWNVAEAKQVLAGTAFDVILADYSLGDGTAFDVLDYVKDVPVIIVTGLGDEEVAVKAWRQGAYDYLIKDFERNYLKAVPITIENAVKYKRTEEKLRLLSRAVMSTEDSVYITDMDDRIIFVNKAFCETYGYDEQEITNEKSGVLWKESEPVTDAGNLYRAVNGWELGFFHKRKDGSEFPVSLSRSEVEDDKGNVIAYVGVARDISERMLMEDKLRRINSKLNRGSRMRG